MSVYNANGNPLSSVYDAQGNELDYAYDVEGNLIYTRLPPDDDYDDSYISGRTLVFEDKFKTIDTNNWGFELGRVRNNELQYYTNNGNNVEITQDNELCITAKRENYVNATWTSASLTSFGKKEFKYGRLEAKIKFPKVAGAFPAFWTLGTQLVLQYYEDGTWMTHASGNWSYCGENDIVEHYRGDTNQITCGAYYSETDEQVIKPYLRPISSMTEEEIEFMGENGFRVYKKTNCFDNNCDVYDDGWDNFYVDKQSFEGVIELFNSHHLDYHGLIPMGLALEAPDDMYKVE